MCGVKGIKHQEVSGRVCDGECSGRAYLIYEVKAGVGNDVTVLM